MRWAFGCYGADEQMFYRLQARECKLDMIYARARRSIVKTPPSAAATPQATIAPAACALWGVPSTALLVMGNW
jgi:phosphodiesterase/alkaline phosphatase D-like protein